MVDRSDPSALCLSLLAGLVPFLYSIAPRKLTSPGHLRIFAHLLCCAVIAVPVLLPTTWRREYGLVIGLLWLGQYWAAVTAERIFEARYGRPPVISKFGTGDPADGDASVLWVGSCIVSIMIALVAWRELG